MKIRKRILNILSSIALAFSSVEKNLLGQESKNLISDVSHERKQTVSNLAEALTKGEVNMEVRNLRWRMYKILQASQGNISKIVGYEKDNNGDVVPITQTIKINKKLELKKIKLDTYDSYPLEMVVDNSPITLSIDEALSNDRHEMSFIEYFSNNKPSTPINVTREFHPQFEIESYTKKVNIRIISNTDRLIEFCVSKYPDPDNRRSNLFLSEIKKIINGKRSGLTEMDEVDFITYKTIGVDDFLNYSYKILKFDKIVEFNGMYVIKFEARIIVNGDNILEKYREYELDKKYENKEMRKHTI